jgi:hypothetical protein
LFPIYKPDLNRTIWFQESKKVEEKAHLTLTAIEADTYRNDAKKQVIWVIQVTHDFQESSYPPVFPKLLEGLYSQRSFL